MIGLKQSMLRPVTPLRSGNSCVFTIAFTLCLTPMTRPLLCLLNGWSPTLIRCNLRTPQEEGEECPQEVIDKDSRDDRHFLLPQQLPALPPLQQFPTVPAPPAAPPPPVTPQPSTYKGAT